MSPFLLSLYIYTKIRFLGFTFVFFFFLGGDDSLIQYRSIVNDVAISIIVFDSFCVLLWKKAKTSMEMV